MVGPPSGTSRRRSGVLLDPESAMFGYESEGRPSNRKQKVFMIGLALACGAAILLALALL